MVLEIVVEENNEPSGAQENCKRLENNITPYYNTFNDGGARRTFVSENYCRAICTADDATLSRGAGDRREKVHVSPKQRIRLI